MFGMPARALPVPPSIGEGFEAARKAAGYKSVDDVVAASRGKISRDFVYQIERIGNRPNAGNPTLSVMLTLCDLYGVELGECFPRASVATDEVQEILESLDDLPVDERRSTIAAMGAFIRTLRRTERRTNVVPFRAPHAEEPRELSEDAMARLGEVMKKAGFEPRKGARGPEREVRFYGEASAGEGIEFYDEIPEEFRQIPQWAWKRGARGVFKVRGWSMLDAGIMDGQIVFVKPTPEPASGETVICTVNRKVFIKKLRRDDKGRPVQLLPKAPGFEPINLTADDEVEFFGVAIGNTGDL